MLATPSPSAAATPDAPAAEHSLAGFDLRSVWRTLSTQRWLIAVTTAILVGATALYSFTATPYYRAKVRLLIEREGERTLTFQEIYSLGTGADDYYVTQYRILESRAVAAAALEQLTASEREFFARAEDPVERLMQLRRIKPVAKSRLVDIEAEHPDGHVATRIAGALVAAYVANVQERRTTASSTALERLRAEAANLQAKLVRASQATQDFKQRHKIVSMSDQQSLVAARLEKLSDELADIERQNREAESRLQAADGAATDASFGGELPEVLESRVVADHKRELLAAQGERSALSQRYLGKHPRMLENTRRIEAIEAQLRHEVDAIHRGIVEQHQRLTRHEADVRQRLTEQADQLLELEQKSIEFDILKNEADNVRRMHDAVLARLKEVEVINDHQASNVHALGAAEVSQRPVRPRILVNLGLALLLGLLCACGLAFAVDALDSSIKTPADAGELLALPVLGMVPRLEGKRAARGAVDPETFDPRSALSEAFRTIRTNFTFSEAGRDMRSLVITSATPEEGKSLVSINLAVSLARGGKRVLLVDADLRRPRLHRAFEIDVELGLSSVLVGAAALEDVTVETGVDGLSLLPCGIIPPNPVELLAGEHTRQFLANALRAFDVVLIDSPPVGVVSDACVLATLADRTVFVVRSFKAHRGHCRRSVAQLHRVGAKLAGCIVNHCDVRAGRYDTSYEYSYLAYDYSAEDAEGSTGGQG